MVYRIFNSFKAKGRILFSLFFIVSISSLAQTWEKEIATGSSEAYPVLFAWNQEIILCYTKTSSAGSSIVITHLDKYGDEIKTNDLTASNADYSFSFNSKAIALNDELYIVGTAEYKQSGNSNLALIKYDLITGNYQDYLILTNDTSDYCLDYIFTDTSVIVPGYSLINGQYFGYIKEIGFDGSLITSVYYPNNIFISGYLWSQQNKLSARSVSNIDFRYYYPSVTESDSMILDSNMVTWGGSFTSSNNSTHYISGNFFVFQTSEYLCSVLKITNDSISTHNYLFGKDSKANKIQAIQPVAEVSSDILYMIGSTGDYVRPQFFADETEIALFKTNQNGDTLFMKFYKGEVNYIANSIIATSDGGALIASQKYDWNSPYPNQWDIHLLKVDSLGNYTPLSNEEVNAPNEIVSVYPNPASDFITISGVQSFPSQLVIYDVLGREVSSQTVTESQQTMDISMLPKGTYVYKLASQKNNFTGKLQVE